MNILRATRGKSWGFRFLRTAGLASPLTVYERAFAGTEGSSETFLTHAGSLAVRFPDPDGRRDRAGRIIPHEFVVLPPDHANMNDVDSARMALWNEVGEQYATIWDQPAPPAADALP